MKLVILDRDGVINQDSPDFIRSAKQWRPIAGSLDAIARLSHNGFRVVVASNQSGIGRGLFDYDALFAIHDKLSRLVAELGGRLDGLFFCPHEEGAQCRCRKPAGGLMEDIARRLQVDLARVPMIGDSWRDVQAAQGVGAAPILVRTGNGAATEHEHSHELEGVLVYEDLRQAADALVGEMRS